MKKTRLFYSLVSCLMVVVLAVPTSFAMAGGCDSQCAMAKLQSAMGKNQLAEHCSAKELLEDGCSANNIVAIIFATAAAVCWFACGVQNTGYGATAASACSWAGGTATVADIGEQINLAIHGQKLSTTLMNTGIDVVGAVGGYFAAKAAISKGLIAEKTMPCITAGALTLGAALKWMNASDACKKAKKECRIIESFASQAPANLVGGGAPQAEALGSTPATIAPVSSSPSNDSPSHHTSWPSWPLWPSWPSGHSGSDPQTHIATGLTESPHNDPGTPSAPSSGSTPATVPTSSSGGASSGFAIVAAALASPHPFPGKIASSSQLGELGKTFDYLPNKDRMPEALKQLTGMQLKDVGQKLQTQSPAEWLVSIPALRKYSAAIQQLDRAVREGAVTVGSPPRPLSGLSGQSLFDSPLFKPQAAVPSRIDMENVKSMPVPLPVPVPAPSSAPVQKALSQDIWHTDSQSTIFEIISTRIEASEGEVDSQEWVTPLNRALNGLPPKKGH